MLTYIFMPVNFICFSLLFFLLPSNLDPEYKLKSENQTPTVLNNALSNNHEIIGRNILDERKAFLTGVSSHFFLNIKYSTHVYGMKKDGPMGIFWIFLKLFGANFKVFKRILGFCNVVRYFKGFEGTGIKFREKVLYKMPSKTILSFLNDTKRSNLRRKKSLHR